MHNASIQFESTLTVQICALQRQVQDWTCRSIWIETQQSWKVMLIILTVSGLGTKLVFFTSKNWALKKKQLCSVLPEIFSSHVCNGSFQLQSQGLWALTPHWVKIQWREQGGIYYQVWNPSPDTSDRSSALLSLSVQVCRHIADQWPPSCLFREAFGRSSGSVSSAVAQLRQRG